MSESHKGLFSGNKNNHAVLKEEQVIDIIDRLLQLESCESISKDYNVSHSTIYNIRNHKTWTHLTNDIIFQKYRKRRNDGKEVVQYNMNGDVINIYESIKLASIKTGIDYRHISAVCNGRKFSAGSYVWRFKNDDFNKYPIERNGVLIDKYDLNGVYVNTYTSLQEANHSISYGKVESVLYGNANSAGGFYWCKHGEKFFLPEYKRESRKFV